MTSDLITKEENLREMIYTIRGVQVMLDSDLAGLYGVDPKRLKYLDALAKCYIICAKDRLKRV